MARMKQDTKENYMRSILGEAEYEANLEDWKEEGLEEGRAEGRAEGKLEIIKSLLHSGMSLSELSRVSGILEEELKELLR